MYSGTEVIIVANPTSLPILNMEEAVPVSSVKEYVGSKLPIGCVNSPLPSCAKLSNCTKVFSITYPSLSVTVTLTDEVSIELFGNSVY